jgi:hypothetical protein
VRALCAFLALARGLKGICDLQNLDSVARGPVAVKDFCARINLSIMPCDAFGELAPSQASGRAHGNEVLLLRAPVAVFIWPDHTVVLSQALRLVRGVQDGRAPLRTCA